MAIFGTTKRQLRYALAGLVLTPACLAAAIVAALAVQARQAAVSGAQYVSVGSSYAAGPFLPPRGKGTYPCGRSAANFATHLAHARGLSLDDRSCSGATTTNLLTNGQWFEPRQLDAVTSKTELVTIMIGGNDVGYVGRIMAHGCTEDHGLMRRLMSCNAEQALPTASDFQQLEKTLVTIAQKVRRTAPDAEIVFMSYPRILPDKGTCPALGLTADQMLETRQIATALAAAIRNAARTSDAHFFDADGLGRNHHVCADTPWISGQFGDDSGTLPIHVNATGMAQVADALDRFLNQPEDE